MADTLNDEQTPENETETSSGASRRRRGSRASNKPAPPDPSKLEFFTLVPEGTKIDFVGNRKRGLLLSLFLVLASIGMMIFNSISTGCAGRS